MKKLLFVLMVLVGGMFGNAVSAQTPNDITLEIVKELPIVSFQRNWNNLSILQKLRTCLPRK